MSLITIIGMAITKAIAVPIAKPNKGAKAIHNTHSGFFSAVVMSAHPSNRAAIHRSSLKGDPYLYRWITKTFSSFRGSVMLTDRCGSMR